MKFGFGRKDVEIELTEEQKVRNRKIIEEINKLEELANKGELPEGVELIVKVKRGNNKGLIK